MENKNNSKKIIIITAIVAFIVGIMATIVIYHSYIVYQLKAKVEQQDIVLTQIVDFLNKSVQGVEGVNETTN